MNLEILITIFTIVAGIGAICLGIYILGEARKLKSRQTTYKSDWVTYDIDIHLFEYTNKPSTTREQTPPIPKRSVIEHLEEELEEVFE